MYYWLCQQYDTVDVLHIQLPDYGVKAAAFYGEMARWHDNKIRYVDTSVDHPEMLDEYEGIYACLGSVFENIKCIHENRGEHRGNEVKFYMNGIEDQEELIANAKIDWDAVRMGRPKSADAYDIIFCNGGVNNYQWMKKKYRRYGEIIKAFPDKKIGCVGLPGEFLYGCDDLTDVGLLRTFDLISRSRVFVSNDTGLYHFASAIGIPNVVLFTSTSMLKNYNPYFHRYAFPISSDCPSMCQGDKSWSSEAGCDDQWCTAFDPTPVIDAIWTKLG